ncbi:MAG: Hsp33 family molecular chaperone HslO, partial [Deltaproteobacteria bacterium]|nr:Hsp33 family molecular chaperone HslO [Deltaproteobacteria bacterium]
MIKKQLSTETMKERLVASAKDRLHNFLLADGAVRGAVLHGTHMVNEMRANHELGILETLVLGRAYLGVALMSANIKGIESISVKIDCSGPIKGLT